MCNIVQTPLENNLCVNSFSYSQDAAGQSRLTVAGGLNGQLTGWKVAGCAAYT